MTPAVALVGGGVSVAALIDEMSRTLALDPLDIRLAAQDLVNLELIAGHGRALVAHRPGWTVEACRSTLPRRPPEPTSSSS